MPRDRYDRRGQAGRGVVVDDALSPRCIEYVARFHNYLDEFLDND